MHNELREHTTTDWRTSRRQAAKMTIKGSYPQTRQEGQLWEERAQLEGRLAGREKMAENAERRWKSGSTLGEASGTLMEEGEQARRDMAEIRAEISKVDRKIRLAEMDGLRPGWRVVGEDEETRWAGSTAAKAREYAIALEEARQRKKEDEDKIAKMEAELREVGEV